MHLICSRKNINRTFTSVVRTLSNRKTLKSTVFPSQTQIPTAKYFLISNHFTVSHTTRSEPIFLGRPEQNRTRFSSHGTPNIIARFSELPDRDFSSNSISHSTYGYVIAPTAIDHSFAFFRRYIMGSLFVTI